MNNPQSTDTFLNPTDNFSIDYKRFLSLFLSNWYWFLGGLFFALTIAYGINRYSEKVFTVSSTLLIRDDQLSSLNSNVESVIPGGDIFKRQQNLKNEIGILKSFTLNLLAVKSLESFNVVYMGIGRRGIVESRLYPYGPFIVKYDSLNKQVPGKRIYIDIISEEKYVITIDDTVYNKEMLFGDKFSEKGFDFTIMKSIPGNSVVSKNSSNKYYFWFEDHGSLANSYRNRLSISPIDKDASLVTLSISGFVPDQEADYLNMLMGVYLNYGLEIKNQTADSTINFIERQLGNISDSLKNSEDKLEKYRLDNKFFDLSREGALIQEKLKNYENVKLSFELQLQYYNYLEEYLNAKEIKGTIISPTLMGITDQALIGLVNELSLLQKEKDMLGFNVLFDQPLAELGDDRIIKVRQALKENIYNGITMIKRAVIEEERKIASIENELTKLPTTERKLIGIQRNFDLNNTVYTYLLEKRSEAEIARASNVSDNRIIDKANQFSTSMIKPKARINIIVALILGLMIPGVMILFIDFFNDKIIDKSDIEKITNAPVIGYISHSDFKGLIPVIEKPGSSFAESFRAVRTALKYFTKGNDKPVIAITSTISSEGKTFISVNLAAIIALLGKRVLIIGLDLRKPRINKVFNIENSPGMSTYLSGNCSYEEVNKPTHIENLFYAASGPIPPNPAELLERDEMKQFLEKAKMEFDFIIIDTPPIAIVTDTMLIAPFVDINLFVVRQRYSSRGTLEIIEQLYQQEELKNLAILLNDINLSGYYGYGVRYGYSLGYGYYYGHNYYGKGYYERYGVSSKGKSYYAEE